MTRFKPASQEPSTLQEEHDIIDGLMKALAMRLYQFNHEPIEITLFELREAFAVEFEIQYAEHDHATILTIRRVAD